MARVLMVCEPPDGGTPENVLGLALGLGAHGHSVEVAGPPDARRYSALEQAGVPVHRLSLAPGYGRPARDARALRALGALARSGRFDIVHCHSAKAGVLGRLAARRAGLPAVYTPHCFSFIGEFSRARTRTALTVERALAPLTDAFICVCEWERDQALARGVGSPERLHVVHNGCPACSTDVDPDPALAALRAAGPVAATLVSLRAQKTVDVFLEAAPEILARVPEARLAVVGEGPDEPALRELAARRGLDRDKRFAFLPYTGPAARHLQEIDVYVLPSSWEAFPIGVLEALACGVPQVATDVGGTGEAVAPDTGVLVPPHDPAALASGVSALLADPGRRAQMAAASRARHAQRFGVERMVAATAAVYEEVLSSRPRRRRISARRSASADSAAPGS
jgi:glycosyltransferase involved in cell wall biosynthesis